ncbi:peptide/nickel transport system ATP-binding protein [Lachnotalea glycerini]|uniref:Peptide/nickel transport system ATP-binding protein n=1 Tax=Lachnotalea glycerini TaxID=1763509 RepID=A0A318ERY1_9FIRM|nr:ABC transporter ATP-binding protein [Lachnotalea glycerini]PXV91109.1 peptide/nickel transport system ATP-binding protein [Lachnotalea glycerini]
MADKLLEIKNLSIEYNTEIATVYAVNGMNLSLDHGETLGLVGETGAGKTTTALSIMRLLPEGIGEVTAGSILLDGHDMLKISEEDVRNLRGNTVSMIFQDPMSSLNPVMTVGDQILEVLAIHNENVSKDELNKKVDQMMELVGIPANRKNEYPHEFSGGMKQRIIIAIALACEPKLILADEPTTALDVTIQAQMLGLINDLQKRLNTAMILITHDLGVVAQTCEKVAVMYAGEVIEYGRAEHIFSGKYLHPYTQGLFNAIPKLDEDVKRLETIDGMIPDPTERMEGCRFASRCKYAKERCKKAPDMIEIEEQHYIKCHLFAESKDKNAGRDEKDGR